MNEFYYDYHLQNKFYRGFPYPHVNMYPSPYLNGDQVSPLQINDSRGVSNHRQYPTPHVNRGYDYGYPDQRYIRANGHYKPNIQPNVPINEEPNMKPGMYGHTNPEYYTNKSNMLNAQHGMPIIQPYLPNNELPKYPGINENENLDYFTNKEVPVHYETPMAIQHETSHGYQQPQIYTEPDLYQGHYQTDGHTHEKEHIHEFTGSTESKDGHKHQFTGTTEPAPNTPNHTHHYWAVTKYDDSHRHEMKGETGPAIPIPGGGHVHMLKGDTYGYPNHQHGYSDKTEKSMGSLPSYQY